MSETRTNAARRSESTRRLIEACIRQLAQRGYAGTSLVEIGKEAGVSRGLVTHYFGTKEACMIAVTRNIRATVHDHMMTVDATGADIVDRLVDTYFQRIRKRDTRARAMYVVMIEALTATPGLRPAVAEMNAVTRAYISTMVRDAVRELSPDPGSVDIPATATVVTGILRGLAMEWLIDPETVDLDTCIETAKSMIRAHLSAAQPAVTPVEPPTT